MAGAGIIVLAAAGIWLLSRPAKKVAAPKIEIPSGPDPAVEAKAAELLRRIEELEAKGGFEEAMAALRQLAGLKADHPKIGEIKARLEEKLRRLEAYLKAFGLVEDARSEASEKDTPESWQKVADACAEAEKLALLEEHRSAVSDLSSLARQRRDWAAAREEDRKGNLEAAIELATKAAGAREAPPELGAFRESLEKKRRKREFNKTAAAAKAEVDPRRAIELWKRARELADDAKDIAEADGRIDALRPLVDPAERDRRYEAAMKSADEALAAGRLEEAEKAYRDARALKGVDLKADAGLAKVNAVRQRKAYESAMADAAKFANSKEWGKAADAYDRALRLKPGDPAAAARRKEIDEVHRPPRISVVIDEAAGIRMDFVLIKPGTFLMGDPDGDSYEKPHEVTITRDFWMQVTEVTQAQWTAVMGQKAWSFTGLPTLPADGVSWEEARKFAEKFNSFAGERLRGRKAGLPTEAEWEYACRAGTKGRYPFPEGNLGDYAWFAANSQKSTQGAGRKKANPWGLHDMLGNVAEWCQDWYGPYQERAVDPEGPPSGQFRVFRGGSWNDRAVNCRPARREKGAPEKESMFVGLRLVLR